MPNLYQNPFDDIVNRAYSMGGMTPPVSTSPLTPPTFPSQSQRTLYDSADPAYDAQLEEELMKLLRTKRQKTTRSKIGNVIRAGVASAAQPNRAYGGPMDILAAFAGGMGGAQSQDILQDKLFEEEKNRQAKALETALQVRQRRAVANAQAGSYNARAAYDQWRMNRPQQDQFSPLVLGNGSVATVNKRDGSVKITRDPNFTNNKQTKEQEELGKYAALIKTITDLDAQHKSGAINDDVYETAMGVIGKKKEVKDRPATWNDAAKVSLLQQGIESPTDLQVMNETERLKNAAKPKKTGGGKKTQSEKVNEVVAKASTAFEKANPNIRRGNTQASIKNYYQALLGWIDSPEAEGIVTPDVYNTVVSMLERKATYSPRNALGLNSLGSGTGDLEAAGVTPKTPPLPATPKPSTPSTPKPKTVKMRAPNGVMKDIPADQVDYYKKRGATIVKPGSTI